ncbi:hypothetical protein C8R45DRAFT_274499 [Mycena sanguinolenta]|nr:hypothetical protein C8R45DRAFT_274499 [Mycena sanguinolenta]
MHRPSCVYSVLNDGIRRLCKSPTQCFPTEMHIMVRIAHFHTKPPAMLSHITSPAATNHPCPLRDALRRPSFQHSPMAVSLPPLAQLPSATHAIFCILVMHPLCVSRLNYTIRDSMSQLSFCSPPLNASSPSPICTHEDWVSFLHHGPLNVCLAFDARIRSPFTLCSGSLHAFYLFPPRLEAVLWKSRRLDAASISYMSGKLMCFLERVLVLSQL